MNSLTATQVYITPPIPSTPPAIPFQFVKPVSYEFRVAEIVENDVVVKVKLQVQVWEHDQYGNGNVKQYWTDVPRVKMDANGTLLVP
jgi:hypothetical protein